MNNLHILQGESVVRIPERIAPKIREWSNEWLQCTPRDMLCEQLKEARSSFIHVSEMKQSTARLIWELRIERIQQELKRRADAPVISRQ